MFQVDRPTVDYASDHGGRDIPINRALPNKIGRYVVLELLGVGGMGVVCTAFDPKLDRKVALKLLRRKHEGHEGRVSTGQARLIREAQALAKLSHPNIVTVHDVDAYEGQVFMAMEYVDGPSLDRWMMKGTRSWREVLKIFIDAAHGLAAAHAAGITHRDFKPANVLLGKDGRVLVVDFGLAKNHDHDERELPPTAFDPKSQAEMLRERGSLIDAIGTTVDTKLTQAGRTVGTPAYMAPEQFLGLPVGPLTDQFSFGVALYEALYRHLPFPDESREELIDRVTEGKVAEPPRDTDVPGWVHRIVLRTLQKRPEDRFTSIDDLIAALQADPAKRRRRWAMIGGSVMVVGLAGYGVVQGVLGTDQEVCQGAEARVATVWGQAQQDRVEEAFEATERPFAHDAWAGVQRTLDAHTEQWAKAHTDICRATSVNREQSSQLMDVRMACLDRRLGEMQALVEVFADADETVVEQAIDAAQKLDNIDDCRALNDNGIAEVLADPKRRAQAEEIEQWLAKSKALQTAGRLEGAADNANKAVTAARELAHPPVMARVALQQARVAAAQAEDPEHRQPMIVEAIKLAAVTDQPALEASAWSMLIALYGDPTMMQGDNKRSFHQALALRLPAEIALSKAQDVMARAAYDQAIGSVLANNGLRESGVASMHDALDGYRALAGGNDQTRVAAVLSNLGAQYAQLGNEAEARHYLGEASRTLERIHGRHHPMVGPIYINLGGIEAKAGDAEAAHDAYQRAEEVLRETMPEDHPYAILALLGLAQTEATIDPERALTRYEQLLKVMRGKAKPELGVMATTLNSLARLQGKVAQTAADEGDREHAEQLWREAQRNFDAAIATHDKLDEQRNTPEKVALTHLNYCLMEQGRGRLPQAQAQCETAWGLVRNAKKIDRHGVQTAVTLAQLLDERDASSDAIRILREGVEVCPIVLSVPLRVALADQLWKEPRTRDEARTLIRTAQTEIAGSSASTAARDSIQAWLDEHPG